MDRQDTNWARNLTVTQRHLKEKVKLSPKEWNKLTSFFIKMKWFISSWFRVAPQGGRVCPKQSVAPGRTGSLSGYVISERQLCEQGHFTDLGYLGRNRTSRGLIYISHFCPLFPLPTVWFYCLWQLDFAVLKIAMQITKMFSI